jgi:hypothetical protein
MGRELPMTRATWLMVSGFAILVLGAGGAGVRGDKGKGTVVDLDGLKSRTPANWVVEKPANKLRFAQFRVPKVGDDKNDTEMIIFHLAGQGGGVDANVKRWKEMFFPPRGKTLDDVAKVENLKVGDVAATYLDVHGTYKYKKAPFVPDSQAELRPDYRMLAVYFNSKNGPYFFRLVGPAATVAQNKKGFDDWLKNFK